MAKKTQGTALMCIDPADGSLLTVGCVTSLNGINTTVDSIDTTCLSDSARTFLAGLANPGQASFGINFDPSDASHVRLHALKVAGTSLEWIIGFSDGTADPSIITDSTGAYVFDPPTSRSWIEFDGFMTDFPFDFAINSVVQSNVSIQVSGEPVLSAKV